MLDAKKPGLTMFYRCKLILKLLAACSQKSGLGHAVLEFALGSAHQNNISPKGACKTRTAVELNDSVVLNRRMVGMTSPTEWYL